MLNTVSIMGRLGKDPEIRRTQSGKAVTSFSLAVDRDFKNADGSRETDWIPIVAWDKTAELVGKYATKGRMLVVTGRLQVRKWKDRDGQDRQTMEVIASNVYFADSKPATIANGSGQNSYSAQPAGYGAQGYGAVPQYGAGYAQGGVDVAADNFEGDLPF